MKKFALLIGTTLLISCLSMNAYAFTPFATKKQAKMHCPATNDLTFTPLNQHNPNSKGTITSFKNSIQFKNLNGELPHPQSLGANNQVQEVDFRMSGNAYGYISNNVTTCFYLYPGITTDVFLNMRSVI